MKFLKKLSWWKGISDFIVILLLIGWLSGFITKEFYPLAVILLIPGFIATIIFIIKNMMKD